MDIINNYVHDFFATFFKRAYFDINKKSYFSKQDAKKSLIDLSNADNQSCNSITSILLSRFSTLAMYDCGFFKDVASST